MAYRGGATFTNVSISQVLMVLMRLFGQPFTQMITHLFLNTLGTLPLTKKCTWLLLNNLWTKTAGSRHQNLPERPADTNINSRKTFLFLLTKGSCSTLDLLMLIRLNVAAATSAISLILAAPAFLIKPNSKNVTGATGNTAMGDTADKFQWYFYTE